MSEFASEITPAPESPAAPEPASPSEAIAAAETPAPEAAAPAAAETGTPGFDPAEMQAEMEYLRSTSAELLNRINEYAGGTQQQQQGFDPAQLSFVDEFGQFDPAAFARYQMAERQAFLQTVEQRFQQIQEPLEAQRAATTAAHYEQLVDQSFEQHAADISQMSPKARDFVEERAGAILSDLNQRFGTNPDGTTKPHVLDMAIEKAAADVRELFGAAGSAATQQQASHLATLAGASAEPGAGAAAAGAGAPQFSNVKDVVAYYSRNGAGFPQG